MQAFVYRRYGGPEVLELVQLPRPEPGPEDILIKIRATTVTSGDWRCRSLDVPKGLGPIARLALGVRGPRRPVLGSELAGTVETVGPAVTKFRVGDDVFGFPGIALGCHAAYRTMPQDGAVALKPPGLSFTEAASIPFGGSTALHFLRKARARRGDRLLVIGASGSVGVALVQIAKHLGAEVTAVTSGGNVPLVRSLGAACVIDYTREDFRSRSERYDIVADTVGATTFAQCRHVLDEGGRFLSIAGGIADMLAVLTAPLSGTRRVIAGPAEERAEDVPHLAELAAAGVLRPVIDATYDFADMRQAHARVDSRRKRGSVVVTLDRLH